MSYNPTPAIPARPLLIDIGAVAEAGSAEANASSDSTVPIFAATFAFIKPDSTASSTNGCPFVIVMSS